MLRQFHVFLSMNQRGRVTNFSGYLLANYLFGLCSSTENTNILNNIVTTKSSGRGIAFAGAGVKNLVNATGRNIKNFGITNSNTKHKERKDNDLRVFSLDPSEVRDILGERKIKSVKMFLETT